MHDQEVIIKIRAGETDAYSRLVNKYHGPLLNYIFKLLGSSSIVEDIGQEVFLSVYKAIRDGKNKDEVPFAATLFLAARNRSISEIRKHQTRKEVVILEDIKISLMENQKDEAEWKNEQIEILNKCLGQLDEPYRKTLLQSLRGETIAEIAQYHGIASGTVKSRISRAKGKLKELVSKYLGGENYD